MIKSTIILSTFTYIILYVNAKTYNTKVVILGGGVAGISASLNLSTSGIDDFILVEARDMLGGRAQTRTFANNITLEMGCNWVQGLGENPINQLAIKHGLKTAPSDSTNVLFYNETGKINANAIYNDMSAKYNKLNDMAMKRIKKNQVDISGRTGLDLVGWNPKDALDNAVEYYVWDWEMGEDPEVSSTIFGAINDYYTYKTFGPGSDADSFVIDPRGFKYIFLEEAKKVFKNNSDPRLLLNTRVTTITYNKKAVSVTLDNGDIINADYAITTFSVGVLQNQDITWSPPLPEWKREGIFGFHMATYTKIFLNFPTQFWDDTQFTVYADPDRRGYFNSWQNLNAPGYFPKNTSTNIFFVTVTQEWALYVESLTDEEVKQELMVVLRKMYGDDIPEATDILFPRWHSDPLFRGSYSNRPIGEMNEHHANMKASLDNRVFFAGEAMSTKFYGFLQGAWFTGADAARQVIQCAKSKCEKQKYYPIITYAKLKANIVKKR